MRSITHSSTFFLFVISFTIMMCANADVLQHGMKCHAESFSGKYQVSAEGQLFFEDSKIKASVSHQGADMFYDNTSKLAVEANQLSFGFLGDIGALTLTFPDPAVKVELISVEWESGTGRGLTFVTLGDDHDKEYEIQNGPNSYSPSPVDPINSVTVHFGKRDEDGDAPSDLYSFKMNKIKYCVLIPERCDFGTPCRKLRGQ